MSEQTKIVPMMGNFNSDKKENKPIPMMGNLFRNLDIQDKTLVDTINLPKEIKSIFKENKKTFYNLDYDEDVDAILNDMRNDSAFNAKFDSIMLEIYEAANDGNKTAKNMYQAVYDALDKKDPKGLRKVFRDAQDRYNKMFNSNL